MTTEVCMCHSPSTKKLILLREGIAAAKFPLMGATAEHAFESYRLTPLAERQAIVRRALYLLSEQKEILARELTEQMGRPIAYTGKEITTAIARGEYLVKISGEALKDTEGEPELGFRRYIRKCPIGPVLISFPWNVCGFPQPHPSDESAESIGSIRTSYSSIL